MPDLVVLYVVDDQGSPHPVVSSADPEIIGAVTKLLAGKLGLTPPARVLDLHWPGPAAGGAP